MQHRNIPRGTFWIGAFCGLVLGIPLLTLVLAAGAPDVPFSTVFLYAAGFAGIPALVTTGGVARLTAYRLRSATPSVGVALRIAAPPMALCGAGLALLVLVPLGPPDPLRWGPMVAGGAAVGIVTAAALAVLVGRSVRRHTREGS